MFEISDVLFDQLLGVLRRSVKKKKPRVCMESNTSLSGSNGRLHNGNGVTADILQGWAMNE